VYSDVDSDHEDDLTTTLGLEDNVFEDLEVDSEKKAAHDWHHLDTGIYNVLSVKSIDLLYPFLTLEKRIHILLDIFHAMQRISKTLKKAHGAFRAFLARLRDAFFWVSKEDLDLLVTFLKTQGLTDDDIQRKREVDWVFFLRNSRRVVPPKDILLERFNRVCDFYNGIKDAATGQPLFSEATWKEVNSLRIHISKGCLSDVPGIPFYFRDGETSDGLPKYRCVRGTNVNEGYHKHLRKLLHHHAGSPQLLHYLLLEFNYRWNIRMGIYYRGLSEEVGGFYDQFMLEEVNTLVDGICDTRPYMSWEGALDFEDTTEYFGLPSGGENIVSYQPTFMENATNHSVPYQHVTKSAKQLSSIMSADLGAPVRTAAEKLKFTTEVLQYAGTNVNFEDWACSWNDSVANSTAGVGVFRKTASHLRDYYKRYVENSNRQNTMAPVRMANSQLANEFRAPSTVEIPCGSSTLAASTNVTSFTPIPAQLKTTTVSTADSVAIEPCLSSVQTTSSSSVHPVESQSSSMPLLPTIMPKPSTHTLPHHSTISSTGPASAAAQKKRGNGGHGHCKTCGHLKMGYYGKLHVGKGGGICRVPVSSYRDFTSCLKCKRPERHFGCTPCFCEYCMVAKQL
jgi:hypothetical protein